MGDVIHALPVVSDVVRHLPQAKIDWLVEESFADLPRLHPAVRQIHRVALRRWRHGLLKRRTWTEVASARRRLGERRYDYVLDLQGLIKSAWVARWAGGERIGFGRASAREPLASLFYHRRFDVDQSLHAIERLRSLAAQAFGYVVEQPPVFSLRPHSALPELLKGRLVSAQSAHHGYAVLLHATSRAEKRWADQSWVELGRELNDMDIRSVLPWGSWAEYERADQLARQIPHALVAPRMRLSEAAGVLKQARLVVGVDTGLTHLAAALDVPTVALFAATPAWRYGPYFSKCARSLGEQGRWPHSAEVLQSALEMIALRNTAP